MYTPRSWLVEVEFEGFRGLHRPKQDFLSGSYVRSLMNLPGGGGGRVSPAIMTCLVVAPS